MNLYQDNLTTLLTHLPENLPVRGNEADKRDM